MITGPARAQADRRAASGPDVIESGPRRRSWLSALFQQAWRRQRRRRLAAGAAVLVLAGAAAGGVAIGWRGTAASHRAATSRPRTAGTPGFPGPGPGPLAAWVGDNGALHVASLATGRQRVVTHSRADPSVPLVVAGGRLYWIDTSGFYSRKYGMWTEGAHSLNLATGKISMIAPGQALAASGDRRTVFVAWTGIDVVEVPADGSGPARQLALPRGWFVASNGGIGGGAANAGAVGDRLLVQSSDFQGSPQPDTLGLWRPGTHQVWVLGRAASANYGVIGTVTLPGSAAGLVAWIPASCGLFRWACIKITNTADMSSLTVRSPTRHGFALGGAFTPNGRALAAFTVTGTGGRHSGPSADLTVINTRTGAVRVVARARYQIGAATLWAAPVPGKDQFLAGGPFKAYAVDPATLATRLLPGDLSHDLNYSTVVFTPPR